MATIYDSSTRELPTVRELIMLRIANRVSKRANRIEQSTAQKWISTLVTVVFHIVAFTSFTIAGFSANPLAGWIVLGFSCLAFPWLIESTMSTPDSETPQTTDPMLRR